MKIMREIEFKIIVLLVCGLVAACDSKPKVSEQIDESKQALPSKMTPKKYDAAVINFAGFGPAKFGDNEESVRMAWGRPLNASEPATGASCYYLYLDPKPEQHQEIAFMLEDGQFVRYDVDSTNWIAPGDIAVGDTMEKVMQAHAGRVENQPHKYIENAHTLIVTPTKTEQKNGLSSARLIFETDANNTIISWRIGIAPQVYYVEGCS